jgi:hypothetical protein
MKYGAISLPAAVGAFTYLVIVVILINVFGLGDSDPLTSTWMVISISPMMIGLGITAVVTGKLGKTRDERPKMAMVGINMGIPAIALGGALIVVLMLFGYF